MTALFNFINKAIQLKIIIYLSVFSTIIILSSFEWKKEKNSEQELYELKFDFGNGEVEDGFKQITCEMVYNKHRGYGLIGESTIVDVKRKGKDKLKSDFCTSNKPFFFVVDLPEGFYEIKITFGDIKGTSATTVKAESRRLMIEKVETEKGKIKTETIVVNVRTPRINNKENIRLKSREVNYLNWDDKLTLEFSNEKPCINAIEIKKKIDLITVFLAGNSTVVDQEYEPWCSWGQMITRFLGPEVVVANYAESGEALKSFQWEKRFDKIITLMKPGDYLFIEFGHNDQKPNKSTYVEPFTGYKEELKKLIHKTQERGGIPVLISPMHRRKFDEDGKIVNTHGDYPLAAKQTAEEENIAFIDLNAMSKILYETFGVEKSKRLFVHYSAYSFPGQEKDLADNSHFNPFGAYQLAKCILMGIKENNLELATYIKNDYIDFYPTKPDKFEDWDLPPSPSFELIKPDGY